MDAKRLRSHWAQWTQRVRRATGRDDGEDLLQAAWLRTAERDAEATANPQAYLLRTAVNLGHDRSRREGHAAAPRPLDPAAGLVCDGAPLQDEVLMAKQRLARTKTGIERLSPRTREIFLMHRLDGLKYREIAARLDISQSAVEKHIAKAASFLASWTEGW